MLRVCGFARLETVPRQGSVCWQCPWKTSYRKHLTLTWYR
jgi:hypothetical protein